jgi:hypothetical protein
MKMIKSALEVLTFIAIIIYAYLTWGLLQNARDSSEITNRPIVAVSSYSPRAIDSAHPKQMFAYVIISNFGHLPTKVRVRKATTFTHDPSVSGPDPKHEAEEELTVPPGNVGNRIDYLPPAPEAEKGWYYLAGIIDYDFNTKHYQTRFCLEFPWPDTMPEIEARLCSDRKTNHVD